MVGRRTRAYGLVIEKPANHAKLITSLIVYFIHQCKIYKNVSAAKQSPQFSCKYKSAGLLVLRKKIHFHKSQKNCIRTKRYFLPPYEKMKEKCFFLSFLNGKVKMFAFPPTILNYIFSCSIAVSILIDYVFLCLSLHALSEML